MNEETLNQLQMALMKLMPLYSHKVGIIFKKRHSPIYGCNRAQNKALLMLNYHHKLMLSQLGEALDMPKGSLTSMVDSLEQKGLVFREADPKDRRKTYVDLTNKGKEYIALKMADYKNHLKEQLNKLTLEEQEKFTQSVYDLVDMLMKM